MLFVFVCSNSGNNLFGGYSCVVIMNYGNDKKIEQKFSSTLFKLLPFILCVISAFSKRFGLLNLLSAGKRFRKVFGLEAEYYTWYYTRYPSQGPGI